MLVGNNRRMFPAPMGLRLSGEWESGDFERFTSPYSQERQEFLPEQSQKFPK
jgi:hypothetical protein